jgi:hypothetical protein
VPSRTTAPATPRRAGAALPGERPRSGPGRAQIGHLLSPPEPPRIRSRPRLRDQHRGNHQRQSAGGLNDGGAQTSPCTTTTTTCRVQSFQALPRRARDPRRRPSTARASPCSFLRGEGVEGEGRGRLVLGFRGGTARVTQGGRRGGRVALDHGEEAGSCGNIPSTDDGRRSSGDRVYLRRRCRSLVSFCFSLVRDD